MTDRIAILCYGRWLIMLGSFIFILGCEQLPPPPSEPFDTQRPTAEYEIGPLDQLQVFVWRSEDLSIDVPVRPDGRVSLPLIGEMEAAGKTADSLAADITRELKAFVQDPIVSVIVTSFGSAGGQTVQVVGEAGQPTAIPFRAGMTVLDVMVAVGGLSEFAAGNDAVLIRGRGDAEEVYGLELESLLNDGNLNANAPVLPGDVILIPKSFF